MVLEQRAQGGLGLLGLQPGRAQEGQGLRPVDRLGHPGALGHVHLAQPGHRLGDLAGQGLGDLGGAHAHDLDLPGHRGMVDPVVQAAALEGVVQLLVRLEVMITAGGRSAATRPISGMVMANSLSTSSRNASNSSSARSSSSISSTLGPGPDGREQRPLDQELAPEQVGLALAQLGGAHGDELARVVPLVEGLAGVDPLVALEADQLAAEQGRQHLGDLGLADPGLALQQQRLVQVQGQVDGGGQAPVGQVGVAGQGLSSSPTEPKPRAPSRRPRGVRAVQLDLAPSIARLVRTLARALRYSELARASFGGLVPSSTCSAAAAGSDPEASACSTAEARRASPPCWSGPR